MKRWTKMTLAAAVSGLVARGLVKPFFLLFIHRARPNMPGSTDSFPSGHTIFFFAVATAVYAYDKRLGWLAYAVATAVGIGRVVIGVHWPTDVMGGAILGILTGWAVVRLIPALRPHHV